MTKEKEIKITGIILAGGKSSRMGYDKGLAIVHGKKIIECVYEVLKQVTDNVIIISNTHSYDDLGLLVFEDIYKDKGPLSGIYTGLFNSTTQDNLIVACDMPFVSIEILNFILNNSSGKQIVIPIVNGNMEPLCGFYKKEITRNLKELIEKEILPVHEVVRYFNILELSIEGKKMIQSSVFTNINSPDDLEKIS